MKAVRITFDKYQNASIKLSPICKECGLTMNADLSQSAWTEQKDLVVVPVKCPGCGNGAIVHTVIGV